MASSILAPLQQILASNGTLGVGLKVFVYESGTTTKLTTYPTAADADAATNANTNPVVLDARGEASMWLPDAVEAYKLVLASASDTDPPGSPITTRDDIKTLRGQLVSSVLPAGTILQVQSTTKTDTFSTTATTPTDVSGLSVSITPKFATSTILVFYSVFLSTSVATASVFMRLMRDSTAIAIGDAAGSRTRATARWYSAANNAEGLTQAGQFLDSPASVAALTYKVQAWGSSSTTYVNRTGNDSDAAGTPRAVSSITVMEIAG